MGFEVRISGEVYDVDSPSISLREQARAVAQTSLSVLVASGQSVPVAAQRFEFYVGAIKLFRGIILDVDHPEFSGGMETRVYSLSVSSVEWVLNARTITKTWRNKTHSQIVQDIFDTVLVEENLNLGGITATSTVINRYTASGKKVFDVLSDIADAIGPAVFWIDQDLKFYFRVDADMVVASVPADFTKIKLKESLADLRTVQVVQGASSRHKATAQNATMIADLATRSGMSGKIESGETDDSLHNLTAVEMAAQRLLERFDETERTITGVTSDLVASRRYTIWPVNLPDIGAVGEFVVVERTIKVLSIADSTVDVSVKLKNRGFFQRYGFSMRRIASAADRAIASISDIASDGVFSPGEKVSKKNEWLSIVAEKPTLVGKAETYSVSTATYLTAFQALATYLNGGSSWSSGLPLWLQDDELSVSQDIVTSEFSSAWVGYYGAVETLNRSISDASKDFVSANFVTALSHTADVQSLQSQIDGNVTAWFANGAPTLSNAPATGWPDDATKIQHLNDTYTDLVSGYSYRFYVSAGVYGWQRITDSDVTSALAAAARAQDTADGKRRVFITTPVTPYDPGDLWDTSTGLKRCLTGRASGAYVPGDWSGIIADKTDYTSIYAQTQAYADSLVAVAPPQDSLALAVTFEDVPEYPDGVGFVGSPFAGQEIFTSVEQLIGDFRGGQKVHIIAQGTKTADGGWRVYARRADNGDIRTSETIYSKEKSLAYLTFTVPSDGWNWFVGVENLIGWSMKLAWGYFGDGSFSTKVIDSSKSDLRLTNAGATPVRGFSGSALRFDGASSLQVDTTALNVTAGGKLSISVWIYVTTNDIYYSGIVGNRNRTTREICWHLYRHDADGSVQLHGDTYHPYKSSYIPPLNRWVHLCAVVETLDSAQVYKLYADTVLVQTVSGYIFGDPQSQIQVSGCGTEELFDGLLDELYVWNGYALTESNIKWLHRNAQLPNLSAINSTRQIKDISEDGVLSPAEKQGLVREYADILTEQSQLGSQASALGVSATAHNATVANLTSYLETLTVPKLWSDTSGTTTIDRATFRSKFSDVVTTKEALRTAIQNAQKNLTLAAQASADGKITLAQVPSYLGMWRDVTPPTPYVIGDTYTRYSTSSGASNRGLFRWNGSGWDRTESAKYLAGQALIDISLIISYKDAGGTPVFGTAADYTGSSTLQAAFGFFGDVVASRITAEDANFRGTLTAAGGVFGGIFADRRWYAGKSGVTFSAGTSAATIRGVLRDGYGLSSLDNEYGNPVWFGVKGTINGEEINESQMWYSGGTPHYLIRSTNFSCSTTYDLQYPMVLDAVYGQAEISGSLIPKKDQASALGKRGRSFIQGHIIEVFANRFYGGVQYDYYKSFTHGVHTWSRQNEYTNGYTLFSNGVALLDWVANIGDIGNGVITIGLPYGLSNSRYSVTYALETGPAVSWTYTNDIVLPVITAKGLTSFDIGFEETGSVGQDIRLNFHVVGVWR